jgi:hypothetical protein
VRFYNLDGVEEDVQNPNFFIDEELLLAQHEAILEMLAYV